MSTNKNPLVSINLLTYNGEKYIKSCLDSVFAQDYSNIEVLIIDNASVDNTIEEIRKFLDRKFDITFITNESNIGFARGHNQLIKKSGGDFVLCLNQDVVLDKDFIKNAVDIFQSDSKIGSVQGKLLRLVDGVKSDIVDTTGLLMLKNRRIINRGQGQKDAGQFDHLEEIFGADGAAPIYRRRVLEDTGLSINIRVNPRELVVSEVEPSASTEYFDEDFFCYKEDVDLAWRMRLYGWKAVYQPKALAWHARGSGDSAAFNPLAIIKERRKLSKISKFYSFKNQRLMQIKNELPLLFLKNFPGILAKELAAWAYVLLFENYTLGAIKSLAKEIPKAFKKRKIIMKNKKITGKEMERWFA